MRRQPYSLWLVVGLWGWGTAACWVDPGALPSSDAGSTTSATATSPNDCGDAPCGTDEETRGGPASTTAATSSTDGSGTTWSDASSGSSEDSSGGAPLLSCEGACGGQSAAGCGCSNACIALGDCCPDFESVCAEAAEDPWQGLSGHALRDALEAYTRDAHEPLSYEAARAAVLGQVGTPVEETNGQLGCIYTGRFVSPDGTATPGGLFNLEHVWPQSLGAGFVPPRSDMHHLFPSTQAANTARGSWWFGETDCQNTCTWADNGSKLGVDDDGDIIFDVRPVSRGNVARAVFYFAVRYDHPITAEVEAVLRAWHLEDPPEMRERARNDAVQALQGNRNPFVDHPGIEARITDF